MPWRGRSVTGRCAAVALLLLLTACSSTGSGADGGEPATRAAADADAGPAARTATPEDAVAGESSSGEAPPESVAPSPVDGDPSPEAAHDAAAQAQAAADRAAGLLAREVPERGTGVLDVVPGSSPAPGSGRVWTIRVEVEGGLPVDGPAFADFVLTTLNDPRGWGSDGSVTFARTDGPAPIRVVLASPATSQELCRPLDTRGTLSCRVGERVVLTLYRWVHGTPDYADDLTAYRQYLVTHEVGHSLGHAHVGCPGPGELAPTMLQQTKGLDGCVPNPWPAP